MEPPCEPPRVGVLQGSSGWRSRAGAPRCLPAVLGAGRHPAGASNHELARKVWTTSPTCPYMDRARAAGRRSYPRTSDRSARRRGPRFSKPSGERPGSYADGCDSRQLGLERLGHHVRVDRSREPEVTGVLKTRRDGAGDETFRRADRRAKPRAHLRQPVELDFLAPELSPIGVLQNEEESHRTDATAWARPLVEQRQAEWQAHSKLASDRIRARSRSTRASDSCAASRACSRSPSNAKAAHEPAEPAPIERP
jgi:hypothetical protein